MNERHLAEKTQREYTGHDQKQQRKRTQMAMKLFHTIEDKIPPF